MPYTHRFTWIRTWPEDRQRVDDGYVPSGQLASETDVLRVFQIVGGPQSAMWLWTVSRLKPADADGLRRPSNHDGFCASKEEAQEAAERAYLGA